MINALDFYKTGHGPQYPEGTEYVYSNLTPRSTKYAQTDEIVVFGFQRAIIKILIEGFNEGFFRRRKDVAVRQYQRRVDNALGQGVVSTEHIEALHDLQYLPVRIKALPEGSVVSAKTPVMTIINTDPKFFWVTNYLETVLSAETWMPMTSASIAFKYRQILTNAAKRTGGDLNFVPVQGHDFSMRGMPGVDAAAASGLAHLTSFIGTDTIPAIDDAEYYYKANSSQELVGVSVPATEHSVMCMGTKEDEVETFRRLLKLYPAGIVSIVSDTWDFWKVMTEYTKTLKEEILARKDITDADGNIIVPGKTVFRPDSGDPVKIITGYTVYDADGGLFNNMRLTAVLEFVHKNYPDIEAVRYCDKYWDVTTAERLTIHEVKGAVEVLWDEFGGTETEKGYRVLDSHVGLIYGDSITLDRAQQIVDRLAKKQFASTNIVLGIGSYTYQYNTRDTYGFAVKATWGQVSGEAREIMKDPKTDDGTKKSATGLLRVELEDDQYVTYDRQTKEQENQGELRTIFLNGKLVVSDSLEDIRERLCSRL